MSIKHLLKRTLVGRFILIPYRMTMALKHPLRTARQVVAWTFRSKEYYNHTYRLTPLNGRYLASFIAVVSHRPTHEIESYMSELESDEELRDALRTAARQSNLRHSSDCEPLYGRRLGWYALVRATKPRVVLETGVDRGLGTAVLAAAIRRNTTEGAPGLIYATEISADCGHLLVKPYSEYCRIIFGDSVKTLTHFENVVDIFLHDSDHREAYEWAEFMAIEKRLHPDAIVLSDNSQQSPKLLEFAERTQRLFLYFQDAPRDHWWPGDGIGAAFRPGNHAGFQVTDSVHL